MKSILIKSFFTVAVFAFVACGGGESSDQSGASGEETSGSRSIEIIGIDNMRFVVNDTADGLVTGDAISEYILLEAIEAAPGEEIEITLTTVSNLPATAMSHNFVLLASGTDANEFVNASMSAVDNEYISPDFEEQVIVATDMLGDGESDTITITVPGEPGEYEFVCSFPGHFATGMRGTLIVR